MSTMSEKAMENTVNWIMVGYLKRYKFLGWFWGHCNLQKRIPMGDKTNEQAHVCRVLERWVERQRGPVRSTDVAENSSANRDQLKPKLDMIRLIKIVEFSRLWYQFQWFDLTKQGPAGVDCFTHTDHTGLNWWTSGDRFGSERAEAVGSQPGKQKWTCQENDWIYNY